MVKSKNDKASSQKAGGIKMVSNNRKIKTVNENTKTLRKLYNQLMSKDKQYSGKPEIIKKILKQIDGNYSEFCFKHDGCRILQGSIKYGTVDQRALIISKLIPLLYDIINGKYSIYLSAKIFKYANMNQRNEIMKNVLVPNYKKLLKFSGGISFMRFVFMYSHSNYQEQLINMYFDEYLKIPFQKIKDNFDHGTHKNEDEDVEMKNENIIVEKAESFESEDIREKIKTHLEKQLENGVSKNYIFHGFLNKVFDYLDEKTQVYISELFDDDFMPFLNNNYGFKLACKLYAVAGAKTRKKVIKLIRENINDLITSDNGTYFIIKIILFTDDTKIIEKNLLKFIVEKLTENFQGNQNIIKIVWNIFFPFNKKCNNNAQQEVLAFSKPYSNKKDLEKRQNEIIAPIFEDLYKIIAYEVRYLLSDELFSIFLTDFISYLLDKDEIEKIEEMLNHITSILELDIKSNKDTISNSLFADRVGHKTIKRIMKSLSETKKEGKKYMFGFIEKIAKLLKVNLEAFLNTKAIFIIVQIMENEKTKSLIKDDLEKFRSEIEKNKTNTKLAGMVLLGKLI